MRIEDVFENHRKRLLGDKNNSARRLFADESKALEPTPPRKSGSRPWEDLTSGSTKALTPQLPTLLRFFCRATLLADSMGGRLDGTSSREIAVSQSTPRPILTRDWRSRATGVFYVALGAEDGLPARRSASALT